jgi:hypothetical protein
MGIRTVMRRGATLVAGSSLLAAAMLAAPGTATAEPAWAPAATATIHPGIQTVTAGGQCTANFVFTDSADNAYIGQAAHCSGTGAATQTNGCTAGTRPLGTEVRLVGSGETGTIAYSSWNTMQARGESDANTCAFNDFALIKIPSAAISSKTNPTVPFWGGPVGLDTNGTTLGETVLSYGNSSLRGGVTQLSPKQGKSLGMQGGGWSHSVYTLTPGIPGDSGSAFLDARGNAIGTLSTITILPLAGSNGVGDLSRELAYAQQHGGIPGLQLVLGTEPFRGPLLPL